MPIRGAQVVRIAVEHEVDGRPQDDLIARGQRHACPGAAIKTHQPAERADEKFSLPELVCLPVHCPVQPEEVVDEIRVMKDVLLERR